MPLSGYDNDAMDSTRFNETSATTLDGTAYRADASWFPVRRLRDRLSEFKLAIDDRAPASTASILLSARSSVCKLVAAANECRLMLVSRLSLRYSSVRDGSGAERLSTSSGIQHSVKSSCLSAVSP